MTAADTWPSEFPCPKCNCPTQLQFRPEPGAPLTSWSTVGLPTRTSADEWPWAVCLWCDWEQRCETTAAVQ